MNISAVTQRIFMTLFFTPITVALFLMILGNWTYGPTFSVHLVIAASFDNEGR